MANEASSNDINNLTYSSLVSYNNETQEVEPALAKTWEVAPDGVTWTFHLRKGARFSDGHPMTAQDVLFSFQVALRSHASPVRAGSPEDGRQVLRGVGARRLHVRGEDAGVPTPFWCRRWASSASCRSTCSKGRSRRAPLPRPTTSARRPIKLVTSGPWRVTQYVPGEKTVLGRNPYWYTVDQQNRRLPYLERNRLRRRARSRCGGFEVQIRRASTGWTIRNPRTIAGIRTIRRRGTSRSTISGPT